MGADGGGTRGLLYHCHAADEAEIDAGTISISCAFLIG
jgi:hypothetical protein